MLAGLTGWCVAVIALVVIWLIMLIRRGPAAALGIAVASSFVFPVWNDQQIFGQPFGIQTTIAVIALGGFVLHPRGRIRSPITALDASLTMLVLVHAFSDAVNDRFSVGLPFRVYGEWVIPYVAGRFAVRDIRDLKQIAPWVAGITGLLAAVGLIEMLTDVNLIESIFGPRADHKFPRDASRTYFGVELKRAFGPVEHPIFFGTIPLLLLPWVRVLWTENESPAKKLTGIAAAAAIVLGIVSSVSRAPLLGLLIAIVAIVALRIWWMRWVFGVAAALLLTLAFVFPEQTTNQLSQFSGDDSETERYVELDGEAVIQSSTSSRFLLLQAYAPAVKAAGLLGYGTEATSTFPPNIPHLPDTARTIRMLRNVDNAFVLLTLRFGWLGAGAFALLLLVFLWTAVSLNRQPELHGFPGWSAAVMFGMLAVMMTVWLSYDFGFELLWLMGTVAGLASAHLSRQSRNPQR